MLYYFKSSHNLKVVNDFKFSVTDEKGMRNACVAKFWGLACFYKNKKKILLMEV